MEVGVWTIRLDEHQNGVLKRCLTDIYNTMFFVPGYIGSVQRSVAVAKAGPNMPLTFRNGCKHLFTSSQGEMYCSARTSASVS
jgi:hypothetical protein